MTRNGRRSAAAGAVAGALLLGLGTPLSAQNPVEGYDWNARALRRAGQPVVPSFEGWYQNPDGSYQLCFGYWSGNTEVAVDIPVGPDNFIEPAQYNGVQPTHFMPVPRTGWRKRFCVFSIQVPSDFGNQDVVWTLRNAEGTFSVPGHLTSSAYLLDEPTAVSRAAAWEFLAEEHQIESYSDIRPEDLDTWLNFDPGQAQGSVAPVLRMVQPPGPDGVGRNGITAGPAMVRVGQPLTMTVEVDSQDGRPARWWLGWQKYSGPGDVTISQLEMETDHRYDYMATTTATFSEPGEYVILVQSIENVQSFERQCCWTNGYVRVNVTP